MKLSEGIKMKGTPAEIPDCSRDDLPQFFVDKGYKVGAEIGVYKGEFTVKLCKAGLYVFSVDPWKAYYDVLNLINPKDHVKLEASQKRQDFLFEHTKRALASYTKQVTFVRKTSMDALLDFKDGSLDFVYIDANHNFKNVAEDICEWSKKVRSGGVVAGHDYAYNDRKPNDPDVLHVKFVVDAYTRAFRVRNWFVLGEYEAKDGEKRDPYRSWMWIKE